MQMKGRSMVLLYHMRRSGAGAAGWHVCSAPAAAGAAGLAAERGEACRRTGSGVAGDGHTSTGTAAAMQS